MGRMTAEQAEAFLLDPTPIVPSGVVSLVRSDALRPGMVSDNEVKILAVERGPGDVRDPVSGDAVTLTDAVIVTYQQTLTVGAPVEGSDAMHPAERWSILRETVYTYRLGRMGTGYDSDTRPLIRSDGEVVGEVPSVEGPAVVGELTRDDCLGRGWGQYARID
ncbi:MAG: hypothetical protein RID81_07000 [Sandaracinaceae bacterium]